MTKSEKLFRAIGEVDPKYIIESCPRKRTNFTALFTAGGICAAALVGVMLIKNGAALNDNIITADENAAASTEDTAQSGTPELGSAADIDDAPASDTVSDYPFRYDGREPEILNIDTSHYVGAMGGGSVVYENIPESRNPWQTDIVLDGGLDSMPVFYGNKRYMMINAEDFIPKLEKIAAALGEELTDIEYDTQQNPEYFPPEDRDWVLSRTTSVQARAGDVKLYAHGGGNGGYIVAHFPKEWEPFTLDKVAELLGYKNPVREEHDLSEDFGYTYVYESSDDLFTAIMNYNFRYFDYRVIRGEVNNLFLTDNLDTLECAGFYPLITPDEAKEKLASGDFSAMYYDWVKDADFSDVEISLSYSPNMDGSYILPYYDCYVKVPDGYAYCSVCAVAPEFIEEKTDMRFN